MNMLYYLLLALSIGVPSSFQEDIKPLDGAIQHIESQTNLVYWREYTGTIPDDAIVASTDNEGNNIYIAQTVINDGYVGLYPTWIREGAQEVYAYGEYFAVVDKYIKILCGPQSSVKWVEATIENIAASELVIGGAEISPRNVYNYIGLYDWYVGYPYGSNLTVMYYADETTKYSVLDPYSILAFN